MSQIERILLFRSKKDFLSLALICLLLISFSLLKEYNNYKEFTKFDSQLLVVDVLKQYTKTKTASHKKTKTYQVLKLRSSDGIEFYTIASSKLPDYKTKRVLIEIWAGEITFLQYLKGFFTFSKILSIDTKPSLKTEIEKSITKQHKQSDITSIYKALFLAQPLPYYLQKTFSNLGISDKFLSLMYN